MATTKADIITDLDATPAKMIAANLLSGKLRIAAFSYDTGASGPAVADIVYLTELPITARVFAMFYNADAMSSGAGTAGADIGDDDDVDRFAAAVNFDAAVNGWTALRLQDNDLKDFTDTSVGIGYSYAGKTSNLKRRIRLTITGEAWAAAKRLIGFVVYSVE